MRYLLFMPLLCAGAITYCLTAMHVEAEVEQVSPEQETPSPPEDEIATEREWRASHRAFYTAPPVIPHELYPVSAGDCLTCHREEGNFFGKTSTRTPHPQWVNCTQCHMPSQPAFSALTADPVETTWQGLESPTDGTRAHVVAPPTIPHRKLFREDCQSCHSSQSPFTSMRGPHPERSNCVQCHLPVSEHEFALKKVAELPAP